MKDLKIIDFSTNLDSGTISIALNFWCLLVVVIIFLLVNFLFKKLIKSEKVNEEIKPVKLKYKIAGAEIEYSIERNYQNIEIAHKIYIELITRKAAIPIDKNDIIEEVYNSWYSLFQTTREELKKISGANLLNNNVSNDLIKLLSDVLNKGLRPHLTEHQAKFKKWYKHTLELEGNTHRTPQEIQEEYKGFKELYNSMKEVNELLIEYSNQLQRIIKS